MITVNISKKSLLPLESLSNSKEKVIYNVKFKTDNL